MSKILSILLASNSDIKKKAVLNFFLSMNNDIEIICIDCDCGLPAQPIACGKYCAYERVQYAISKECKYDFVIGIENDITIDKDSDYRYFDRTHVCIMSKEIYGYGTSEPIILPTKKDIFHDKIEIKLSSKISGYDVTGGEIICKGTNWNPKNWMAYCSKVDRSMQIQQALEKAYQSFIKEREIIDCEDF